MINIPAFITTTLATACIGGLAGLAIVGTPIAMFIPVATTSPFLFGAAVGCIAGGAYVGFAGLFLAGLSGGFNSEARAVVVAAALVAGAGVTSIYKNGLPRPANTNDASITAAANTAFSDCPAQKRVTTITQDAKGKQIVTMTCRQ